MATYLTIAPGAEGTSVLVEKRSRFLGFARHTATEQEARAFIAELTRRYHDARHVCWAFALRGGRSLSSDNGEPSGTAGRPILGQITASGLEDVAVGVVRWFGGVKLGPSGLIAAYRTASRDALYAAGRAEVVEKGRVAVSVAWERLEPVMKVVKARGVEIEATESPGQVCRLVLAAPLDGFDALLGALRQALGLHGQADALDGAQPGSAPSLERLA